MKYAVFGIMILMFVVAGCSGTVDTSTLSDVTTTLEPSITQQIITTTVASTTTVPESEYNEPFRMETLKYVKREGGIYNCTLVMSDSERQPTATSGKLDLRMVEEEGFGKYLNVTVLDEMSFDVSDSDFEHDDGLYYTFVVDINEFDVQPSKSKFTVEVVFDTPVEKFESEKVFMI